MKVVHSICCGLDVHAKTVVACLIKEGEKEFRTFSTMTDDLIRLKEWLIASGCLKVGIESTGVYWRPCSTSWRTPSRSSLLNARDVKGRRGRKTDMRDSEWIAEMVQYGLVEGSFIPRPTSGNCGSSLGIARAWSGSGRASPTAFRS